MTIRVLWHQISINSMDVPIIKHSWRNTQTTWNTMFALPVENVERRSEWFGVWPGNSMSGWKHDRIFSGMQMMCSWPLPGLFTLWDGYGGIWNWTTPLEHCVDACSRISGQGESMMSSYVLYSSMNRRYWAKGNSPVCYCECHAWTFVLYPTIPVRV